LPFTRVSHTFPNLSLTKPGKTSAASQCSHRILQPTKRAGEPLFCIPGHTLQTSSWATGFRYPQLIACGGRVSF
jgi:hypothetical protein